MIVQRNKLKRRRGAVLAEFVIVAPLLFVLFLVSLEFAFISVDQNMLTSAAYSAARLGVKAIQDTPPMGVARPFTMQKLPAKAIGDGVCPTSLYEAMQSKIAFKMAAVVPGITSAAINLGNFIGGGSVVNNIIPETDGFPLARILDGYLPARYLVDLDTCKVSAEGVEVTAVYWREGKIPFAKDVLWALYALQTFINAPGVAYHRPLAAELDSNFFGVILRSPLAGNWNEVIKKMLADRTKKIRDLRDKWLKDNIFKYAQMFGISTAFVETPINNFTNDLISTIEGFIGEQIDAGKQEVDGATAGTVQDGLRLGGLAMTRALYVIPEFLRLMPMRKTVFLTWEAQNIEGMNTTGGWKGMNYLIAPYKYNGGDQDAIKWDLWTRNLVGYDHTAWNTKREYLSEP